ncbi:hypothetical protein [Defluviicoccus vanus]|uniref:Uncharacterized protein n=1 Tax=Defluviicoccus vanus TaxID=111831 RepID=A0A7H1MZG6_9PROT|nr:hypothetical protein [Defluviicoccus vanus]QNT68852.1 hypothetical protein HQ394_05140 [Defluviicoccus vanus]
MTAASKVGWVGYAVAFVAAHAGLDTLFLVALILGMACHWRFWRIGLPVLVVSVMIGWHWGGRR